MPNGTGYYFDDFNRIILLLGNEADTEGKRDALDKFAKQTHKLRKIFEKKKELKDASE